MSTALLLLHCVLSLLALIKFTFYASDYCELSKPFYKIILAHSCGYYLVDLSVSNYFRLADSMLNIHHLFVLIGFLSNLNGTHGGAEVIQGLLSAELTNPFYYTRLMSELFAMENEVMIKVNNVIFLVLFTIIRGYFANKAIIDHLPCKTTGWLSSTSLCLISVVSSYWLFKIVSIAFNIFYGKTSGNKAIRYSRATLRFLSSNKYGKHVFPAFVMLLVLRGIQLKYS